MTTRSLGEVARFVNGAAFKPTDWTDQGLPIIRIQNLTGTGQNYNYTTREVKPELVVRPNDLLVSWSATLDVYRWAGPTGVLNQHIFKVLPNQGVDADYLYFALKNALAELSSKTHGSTMKHVVRGDFESTRIRLPSVHEQRRIVDLLTRAEGIVRLRREAAAKAAELIPALFIHHFGDPEQAEPQGLATLGSVLSRPIRNGVSPSKAGKYPGKVLTLSAITRGSFDETAVKDSEFASPLADNDLVSSLDMLVCRGNGNKALVGAACFAPRDMPGVAFPDTAIAVRPDQSVVLPSYLETLWATAFIRRQIDAIAKTTNGTYKINQTGLASIRFPVPPLERQQTFGVTLMQLKGLIAQQAAAEAKAEATFDALLAQAFAPT